jgi:uncharacterized protein YjiS (DUF1127 family)
MSARIIKAEVAFLLPSLPAPAAERAETLRQTAASQAWAAAGQRLGRMVENLLGWPDRATARAELRDLTDRQLADLGLSRHEIDAAVCGRLR